MLPEGGKSRKEEKMGIWSINVYETVVGQAEKVLVLHCLLKWPQTIMHCLFLFKHKHIEKTFWVFSP